MDGFLHLIRQLAGALSFLFIVNIVLLNRVRVSVMVRVSVSFNVSIT